MDHRGGEILIGAAVAGLIAVTGFGAVQNVLQKGWNGDAAAWAQAAGSIVAIVSAAWIARGEARHARRWRRQQGEEAAWGVRFVLKQAQFDAQIVAAELTNGKDITSLDVLSWQQRCLNVSLALQTILTRTDHIHPAVILTATNAKVLVDQLTKDVLKFKKITKRREKAGDELVGDIVYAHINLNTLIDEYDARVRGIRLALDEGQDMLPINWRKGFQ